MLGIVQSLKFLKKFHIGNWADDNTVKAMVADLKGLEDLRVESDCVTCDSLNCVLE